MRRSLATETRIGRRSSDEFLGLCIGVLADGVLTKGEIDFLELWVSNRPELREDPLVEKVMRVFDSVASDADSSLQDREGRLIDALIAFTGGVVVDDPGASIPSALPLDSPPPAIEFAGKSFCFTGLFDVGSRSFCEGLVKDLGASVSKGVNLSIDYLVIGARVSPDWLHSSYGAKIEKAVAYRDGGRSGLSIVSEAHWMASLKRP